MFRFDVTKLVSTTMVSNTFIGASIDEFFGRTPPTIENTGYDSNNRDLFGFDRNGYDKSGFDEYGYDKFGNYKTGFSILNPFALPWIPPF